MGCNCEKSILKVVGLFLLVISISFLYGCTSEKSSGGEGPKKVTRRAQSVSLDKIKKPILPKAEEFGKIVGWLSDETIVYFTHNNQHSSVYTYHLLTGKQQKIYETQQPIISANIAPSMDKLLLHTSNDISKGTIIVIDRQGKNLVEKSIDSTELLFVWNSYDENLVLVTAFNEQWEFTVSVLNIADKKFFKTKLTQQPFANWMDKNEVVYLDWDLNEPAFFAKLVKQNITEAKSKKIDVENVFQLFGFQDAILTLSVDEDDPKKAIYTFLSKDLKPIQSFSIPHLTRFSDWLVPYNDYNQERKLFFTLRPIESGAADTYQGGFQLMRYSLQDHKEEIVLQDLENKQINVSPSGKLCLYGHQLENLILLDSKEIITLIES